MDQTNQHIKMVNVEVDGTSYSMSIMEDLSITPVTKTYSFNGGKTWHDNMKVAFQYRESKEEAEPPKPVQTWLMTLLAHVQSLNQGDIVKVCRSPNSLDIIREQVIASIPASDLEEMDFNFDDAGDENEISDDGVQI